MANEKHIKGVIIPRHDTAINWSKAINFVPNKGELIVFDADVNLTEPYTGTGTATNKDGTTSAFVYESSEIVRFKFGDGLHNVNILPFVTTGSNGDVNPEDLIGYATEDWVKTYVDKSTGAIVYTEHETMVGHRIELPDVYPIQADAEFKVISRNMFKPNDKIVSERRATRHKLI